MLLLALPALTGCAGAPQGVTVFAAASTREAVEASVAAFEASGGPPVVTSFAASSTLARQIEAGAPADLFLSANTLWMDTLGQKALLAPGSRRDLLRGELLLIASTQASPDVLPASVGPESAPPDLAGGCLALGDPSHVPAGIYGRAALEGLGWWSALEPRVVPAADVRAALALVQRGECALGVVYASDLIELADGTSGVVSLGAFPSGLHPAVIYPAALTLDAMDGAAALLDYLSGPEAAAAFTAAGFTHLQRPAEAHR